MWGLYTLLVLLNSSCGATGYTRRNRHNQKEGPPIKQKIVDNESLDGDCSDGVERIIYRCIYVYMYTSYIIPQSIYWYEVPGVV